MQRHESYEYPVLGITGGALTASQLFIGGLFIYFMPEVGFAANMFSRAR